MASIRQWSIITRQFHNRSPFSPSKKRVWKERISIAYAFFSTCAFITVLIACFNGRTDLMEYYGMKSENEKSVSSGRVWAKRLGIENATIYKVKGFTLVDTEEIKPEDDPPLPFNEK